MNCHPHRRSSLLQHSLWRTLQRCRRCLYEEVSRSVRRESSDSDSLESMLTIPPEPRTWPPCASPLSPDDAFPPVAPLPLIAQPAVDPPPLPALLELTFMRVGMPPLSPESTLPPETLPEDPVWALPPVVNPSSRRLLWVLSAARRKMRTGEDLQEDVVLLMFGMTLAVVLGAVVFLCPLLERVREFTLPELSLAAMEVISQDILSGWLRRTYPRE